MRRQNILILSLLLVAQFLIVRAQETSLAKGTEASAFRQSAENSQCLVFGKYVIRTTSGDDVGENIDIYRRVQSVGAENSCERNDAPYFMIKNADANYFAGLSGEFLFVDNGTGADGRGLEIFNLQSKKSIYSTKYYDEFEFQPGRFVVYDKLSETKGVLKNCRQAAQWKKDGLSLGWVRRAKLDLQTLKETPVGAIRCRAFQ